MISKYTQFHDDGVTRETPARLQVMKDFSEVIGLSDVHKT